MSEQQAQGPLTAARLAYIASCIRDDFWDRVYPVQMVRELYADNIRLRAALAASQRREAQAWSTVGKIGGDGWRKYADERARLAAPPADGGKGEGE